MKTAIEFKDVVTGYNGKPVAYPGNLTINAGEFIGLLGPNGAGKTTLLRCLTGICPPISGTVSLFEKNALKLSAAKRARYVAVVPQELETPISFTVQEMVMIGRTASLSRWKAPESKDKKIVERAMAYTDVVDMKTRLFTELSGGEKQRAIVAMALAQEPKIILMDEATSHLDINHRLELMQIIEKLNKEEGVTIIMASHNLNLSSEFCPRLIMMNYGRIISDGTPSEVLTEDLLRRVYKCDVKVTRNPANGNVSVFPTPRLAANNSGAGTRIHVIAGGGCGEEILRRLSLCNYQVTCGVVNQGDSDAEVAAALDIETSLENPFSRISTSALNLAHEMANSADAVIISSVPFGTGNVINLEIAEKALKKGKRVLIMDGIEDRDHTPDKDAVRIVEKLLSSGAETWSSITDLLILLEK